MPNRKLLAYLVHLFTASGILSGFMALLAIQDKQWQTATAWLFLCQVIDGIDGTFARYFKVETVLPEMDGKTIDQVIDFVTYALLPAYFLYHAGLVPVLWQLPCAAAMLLSAAMYYGKKGMVSENMHFIGFPVMWNVVVFYLFFVFHFPPEINTAITFLFAILHFVPWAYPYPTRALEYRYLTLFVSISALAAAGILVWKHPRKDSFLSLALIAVLVYYTFLMWRINRQKDGPLLSPEPPFST
ncbi:MAG: CDP-alcohol phosphatidyltransferase family protein [Saprospiraceae bacterium]|jgi:phosphatidylcholine synthase